MRYYSLLLLFLINCSSLTMEQSATMNKRCPGIMTIDGNRIIETWKCIQSIQVQAGQPPTLLPTSPRAVIQIAGDGLDKMREIAPDLFDGDGNLKKDIPKQAPKRNVNEDCLKGIHDWTNTNETVHVQEHPDENGNRKKVRFKMQHCTRCYTSRYNYL